MVLRPPLGLSPHPHQHTAGIPVPGADRGVQRGLGHHFSACLPTHLLHRQPTCWPRFNSYLCHFPALQPQAQDAFSRSHPGLTQAHQAQISLLGYPQFSWCPVWVCIYALSQGKSFLENDTSPPCPRQTLLLSFSLDNAKLISVEHLLRTRLWDQQVTCMTSFHAHNHPLSWTI